MTITAYLMDPECLIEFAKIPNNIPGRFMNQIYDELWAYWLEHCKEDPIAYRAAIDAIKARQDGWCSQADVRDAGFIPMDGRPMVPEAVVKEVVTRIINSECPC